MAYVETPKSKQEEFVDVLRGNAPIYKAGAGGGQGNLLSQSDFVPSNPSTSSSAASAPAPSSPSPLVKKLSTTRPSQIAGGISSSIRNLAATFRRQAGTGRIFEQLGGPQVLSEAASGSIPLDSQAVKRILEAGYKGPTEPAPELVEPIRKQTLEASDYARALSSPGGFMTLLSETPTLTPGEARFETELTYQNPELRAQRQKEIERLQESARLLDPTLRSLRELAQRREEEEEAVRQAGSEFLTSERERLKAELQKRAEEEKALGEQVSKTLENVLGTQVEVPEAAKPAEATTEPATTRAAEAPATTSTPEVVPQIASNLPLVTSRQAGAGPELKSAFAAAEPVEDLSAKQLKKLHGKKFQPGEGFEEPLLSAVDIPISRLLEAKKKETLPELAPTYDLTKLEGQTAEIPEEVRSFFEFTDDEGQIVTPEEQAKALAEERYQELTPLPNDHPIVQEFFDSDYFLERLPEGATPEEIQRIHDQFRPFRLSITKHGRESFAWNKEFKKFLMKEKGYKKEGLKWLKKNVYMPILREMNTEFGPGTRKSQLKEPGPFAVYKPMFPEVQGPGVEFPSLEDYTSITPGVAPAPENVATPEEIARYNRLAQLGGAQEQLTEPTVPYSPPKVNIDTAARSADIEQAVENMFDEMSKRGKKWRKRVKRAREAWKQAQSDSGGLEAISAILGAAAVASGLGPLAMMFGPAVSSSILAPAALAMPATSR